MKTNDKIAMAAAAHPDDIEFMMSGTLMRLGEAGYRLHYLNVANGCCGTARHDKAEIAAIRTAEARRAAGLIGAAFHEPLVDDLGIYYEPSLIARLCGIVRQVRPRILLVPSLSDYMEDHVNTARAAVTAAFCRGMRNFAAVPPAAPVAGEMAVYHALPYGLRDPLGEPVRAKQYVNVEPVMARKREMLACHQSQKQWLDESQGLDSYLNTMRDMCAQMGEQSARWAFAEGWTRHLHLGFGPEGFDPLGEALGEDAAAV